MLLKLLRIGSSSLLVTVGLLVSSACAQLQFAPATRVDIPGGTLSMNDDGPTMSADNLTLFFVSDSRFGKGEFDLWQTSRATATGLFGNPVNLGNVNSSSSDANPEISQDGLSLYFNSDRPGTAGELDIYVATRVSTSVGFGTPVKLQGVNTAFRDGAPDISADGLTLVFTTNAPGGQGNRDIYTATRATTSDPFESVTNLGATVNTADEERFPSLAPDGLSLIFSSDRPGALGGLGDYDLYMTSRATLGDQWGDPVNLGKNVNSRYDELNPDFAWDQSRILFDSYRSGNSAIYQATIVPEPATGLLLVAGAVGLGLRTRQRRSR